MTRNVKKTRYLTVCDKVIKLTLVTRYFYCQIDEKSVEFYLHFNKTQARYAQVIGLKIYWVCMNFLKYFEFLTLIVFEI